MESLLVSNAKYIRAINDYGIRKMMRNILALQQNIKTIAHDGQRAGFERAKRYYTLCSLSPLVSALPLAHDFLMKRIYFRNYWTSFERSKNSPLTSTRRCWIFSAVLTQVKPTLPVCQLRTEIIACISSNYMALSLKILQTGCHHDTKVY